MAKNKPTGGREMLDAQDILENKLGVTYGSTVADLGCGGAGYFTFIASDLAGENGKVYAVDILKMVLKNIENVAKMEGVSNVETVWSNLENYGGAKIIDGSVDFAMIVNVLFQNKAPEKVLREASRLLKSGGKLLVIDWKEGRFPFGPKAEMKINPGTVADLALGASLKKKSDIVVGKYHFGIILEKI